jgi:hypothetical protein
MASQIRNLSSDRFLTRIHSGTDSRPESPLFERKSASTPIEKTKKTIARRNASTDLAS